MVYPNLRLTESISPESETVFEPLPFRLVDDLLHPPRCGSPEAGEVALEALDRLSLSLDSFRRQLDELEDDGPRPAA